jgi:hypothetical protein
MLQIGGDRDFAEESLGGGGELGPHHLERHLAVVFQVFGEIDCGHATAAQLALERVAIRQGFLEASQLVRHRPPVVCLPRPPR